MIAIVVGVVEAEEVGGSGWVGTADREAVLKKERILVD
jgi:hypothetical protein